MGNSVFELFVGKQGADEYLEWNFAQRVMVGVPFF